MAHAERCPICYGKGKLPPEGNYTTYSERPCYGCDGRGWVEVRDYEHIDLVEELTGLRQETWPTGTSCPSR